MDPAKLKASYDQMNYLSDKLSGIDKDLLQSQSFQNIEGLKSQQQQTQNILDTQERAQYANENRQNRNFTLLNDGIKDQGSSVRDTIFKTSAITNDYINKGASDNLLATERIGAHVDDNIYRTAAGIDQSIYRSHETTNDLINSGRMDGQRSTNELIGYLKSTSDQNWKNFNETQRQE